MPDLRLFNDPDLKEGVPVTHTLAFSALPWLLLDYRVMKYEHYIPFLTTVVDKCPA